MCARLDHCSHGCSAMENLMGPDFRAHQHQREDGHSNLKPFRAPLLFGDFALPPPRFGARSQMPDPSQYQKVNHGANYRQRQHRDSQGIAVKGLGRGRNTASGERGEPDAGTNAIHRKHCCAKALKQSQNDSGAGQDTDPFCAFQLTSPRSKMQNQPLE